MVQACDRKGEAEASWDLTAQFYIALLVPLMATPLTLLSADHALFGARRHAFLAQMQQLLPWAELVAWVSPSYDVAEGGRVGRGWIWN